MAYLTLTPNGGGSGTTVPVELGGSSRRSHEVGSFRRAFSGIPHSSRRDLWAVWTVRTAWIPRATANTLITLLTGTQPLSASGDLTGSITVLATPPAVTEATKLSGGEHVKLEFELWESA